LAALYELLTILLTSFLLNIIPFASPSNLLIASNAAMIVEAEPLTVGFLVALGSTSAKLIHYTVTFFIRGFICEKRRERIDASGLKFKRWAFLALFVVAATPLPDEPVVIPLGLMKYNPAKFCLAFFAGKLLITVIGAYLGTLSQALLLPFISQEILIAASIILTIVVTIALLKIDVTKIAEKILKRKSETS
jgi:membrane protein DedA with SNARE-associated domain